MCHNTVEFEWYMPQYCVEFECYVPQYCVELECYVPQYCVELGYLYGTILCEVELHKPQYCVEFELYMPQYCVESKHPVKVRNRELYPLGILDSVSADYMCKIK